MIRTDSIGYLYVLTFLSGKKYIGITKCEPTERYRQHGRDARRHVHHVVYKAWKKYGAPHMEVLAIVHVADLHATEIRAIAAYGTRDIAIGYNLTDGGDGLRNPTAEVRARIGAAAKKRFESQEYRERIASANRGKTPSPETRAKMAAAQLGKPKPRSPTWVARVGVKHSAEARAKMSLAWRNRGPISAETRLKISLAGMGRKPSPETLAKLRSPKNVAARTSPAALAKMVAANLGKPKTPEHVAKSVATKKRRRLEKQLGEAL